MSDRAGDDEPRLVRVGLGATPEGDNSAYILPERGIVVDPGPPTDHAWDRLRDAIERGTGFDAIDHILVTHWHVDHAGLAPRLAEAADATIHMHAEDAPLVADYAAERERRLERDRDRLFAWGVPESLVEILVSGDTPSPVPDAVPVDPLADGDRIAGVECLHTPGHTAGHAVFLVHDDDTSVPTPVALVGDLVLPGTSPNVGGGDTRMRNPLPTYLDSLDRLERRVGAEAGHRSDDGGATPQADASEAKTVHPGHGMAFALAPRLAELRDHHDERLENCVAAVADLRTDAPGVVTPFAVAETLFGEMRGIHAKMGAGEAASHLAAAAAGGRLIRVSDDPLAYESV